MGDAANRTSTRGMTLWEVVFAVSIVGAVLLMAVNGGRAAIETMRALSVSYALEQFQGAILDYQVEFRQLPGDDPVAPKRWRRPITLNAIADGVVVSLAGNGVLDGELFDLGSPAGEQFAAWRDLRYSGRLTGDASLEGVVALPENVFGGFFALDSGNLGQKDGSLCATKVPGRAAEMIDKRLDDGKINGGKLVATSKFSIEQNNHFDAPDTAPYDIEKEYIICVPLLP